MVISVSTEKESKCNHIFQKRKEGERRKNRWKERRREEENGTVVIH
jgi:hypothetical protein